MTFKKAKAPNRWAPHMNVINEVLNELGYTFEEVFDFEVIDYREPSMCAVCGNLKIVPTADYAHDFCEQHKDQARKYPPEFCRSCGAVDQGEFCDKCADGYGGYYDNGW
jgi:hypothetical protein